MQKLAVCILLFSIIAKPLYVGAIYGNYFFDVEGFIEKYCVNKQKVALKCNGKCELAKQLNSSSDNNHTPDSSPANASDSFVIVYFKAFSETTVLPFFLLSQKQKITGALTFNLQDFNPVIDHPPEFL